MDILLIAGHGAGDPGACAQGYEEADLTREVVSMLEQKLQGYANVDVYPMDHSAYHDLSIGDLQTSWTNYDYVLEVHFNAGGGEGTEIYVTRIEEATDAEETIMDHMGEYFNVRGVKRMNFNVIYSAKRAGVSSALLEVCFIDSDDMDIYENNKDGVVQSIADGIIEGFGLGGDTPQPGPEPQPDPGPSPEPTPDPQPEPMPGEHMYINGSTPEPVYADYYMTQQIGELAPGEVCVCIAVYEGKPIVRYMIDDTLDDEGNFNEKIGFVEWTGGIQE